MHGMSQFDDASTKKGSDSSYRIRRTFIDIEDPTLAAESATPLRRISSDPAVALTSWHAQNSQNDDDHGSDEEGQETCSTSSTSPSRDICQQGAGFCIEAEQERLQTSLDSSSVASSTSATNHADLLAENVRLAEENKLLRENMRLIAENRTLATEVAKRCSKRASKQASVKQQLSSAASEPAVPCPAGRVTAKGDAVSSNVDQQSTNVQLDMRTTVMWRNLPNNYTRAMLLKLLDDSGFSGQYDFVYMPMDFKTHASLGYAFINLTHPSVVAKFWKKFDGYSRWAIPSKKASHVSWSEPHQGFTVNVDRYRNSPIMHESVPDEYKPVVFVNGVRMCFPAPTKKPRAPRYRQY